MPQNSNFKNDEIDLHELLATLWSHKMLIFLITALSIFLSGYHLLTTEKKFTAHAKFQIEQIGGGSGFNLSGEIGALASLAGIDSEGAASNSAVLLERVKAREFIIDMQQKLAIERDNYLNPYDPDYKDPFWKATIKQIVGWQKNRV
jgi:uncharacterized protein involved in exopolysaccharide biosynthesis